MSNSSLVLLRTSSAERSVQEGAPYKHVSICKIGKYLCTARFFPPHSTSVFSLLCKHITFIWGHSMWKYPRQRACLKVMNDWQILRLERCQKKSHVRLYMLSPNAQRRGKGGKSCFNQSRILGSTVIFGQIPFRNHATSDPTWILC